MKLNNQKGAALAELALTLLLLMTIVFGIFEYGRAMYITNILNNAAREGARRAAVSSAPINVDAYVTSCIPFDDKTGLVISTNSSAPSTGATVTVRVTLPFRTITEMFPMLKGRILRGEATMRYEL